MQHWPESLAREVSDFIDFLLIKHDQTQWALWSHFQEGLDWSETDFSDDLANFETYEKSLAHGDIRW